MAYIQGNNGSFAQVEIHESWLSTEFGESYARRTFGNEIVDALPRYIKGKRKGQLKGKIMWRKAVKGGWIPGAGIVPPGKTFAHGIWGTPFGEEPVLLHGYDANDRDVARAALNHDKPQILDNPPFPQDTVRSSEETEKILAAAALFREQGNTLAADLLEKAVQS
jgi:hypothetical protein